MASRTITTQKPRTGLALSGGGYRATLFALGSLWRLNELGYLKSLDRITGVSGGSITLGHLAQNWQALEFDEKTKVASNFQQIIAKPIQDFCSQNLDIKAIISGLLSPTETIGNKVAKAYQQKLFGNTRLEQLPSGAGIPEFIFYATNYDTGSSVRITNKDIYDYKLGEASSKGILLSQAVGASSAFPPYFAPVIIDSSQWQWQPGKFSSHFADPDGVLHQQLTLVDGGLYDNMGIEAIWKTAEQSDDHFDRVLVCDAGAPLQMGFGYKTGFFNTLLRKTGLNSNWGSQLTRMTDIMVEQQRALRRRQLINNYLKEEYEGCYWGIKTNISEYGNFEKLATDSDESKRLAAIATRLTAFSGRDQAHLINWGYALTDAAIREHVDHGIEKGSQPISQFLLP